MEKVLFELEGTDGFLYVFEDRIEMRKKTGWNWTRGSYVAGGSGARTIPISAIRSVEIREVTDFVTGMLYFDTGEGLSRENPLTGTNNQFLFGGVHNKKEYREKTNALLHRIKDYIENTTKQNATVAGVTSDADELKKFKALLDEGIISQEEFDAKKKQILNL